MSTTDKKMQEQLGEVRKFEDKIHTVINHLEQTKPLLFALSYNHQALLMWLTNNPQFNQAIDQYKKSFLANKLHENKELQELLQSYFNMEKKYGKDDTQSKLMHYLRLNPNAVNFLAENLPNLVDGAKLWSRDQQAYFDYFDHKNQSDSLKTQLMTGFGKTSPTDYAFPHINPFSVAKAYEEITQRLEALETTTKNPIDYHHAIERELFYIDRLSAYCQMQLNVSQFENQYFSNNHHHPIELFKLKNILVGLDALKTTFMSAKVQVQNEVDAQVFVTNLEKYIRNYDWKVGYQLTDRFLDDDTKQKRIPTQVALQLDVMRQAQQGKITYVEAEYQIREIGALASQGNNSFKYRLLAKRDQSTKDYYDLFAPGNDRKLFNTVMNRPIIHDHPTKVCPY